MFVTTQGEYALRCMVALASAGEERTLSLKQMAEAEGLSRDYLGKLIHRLKKAGLVNPVHGSRGGYRLSRHPREITVDDVYVAAEGDGFKVFCLDEAFPEDSCRHISNCGLRQVWRRVHEAAHRVMAGIDLESLTQGEACASRKLLAENAPVSQEALKK